LALLQPAVTSPPAALKTLTVCLTQAKAAVEKLEYSALKEGQLRLAVVSAETSISLDRFRSTWLASDL
jgi:hypothetical protein